MIKNSRALSCILVVSFLSGICGFSQSTPNTSSSVNIALKIGSKNYLNTDINEFIENRYLTIPALKAMEAISKDKQEFQQNVQKFVDSKYKEAIKEFAWAKLLENEAALAKEKMVVRKSAIDKEYSKTFVRAIAPFLDPKKIDSKGELNLSNVDRDNVIQLFGANIRKDLQFELELTGKSDSDLNISAVKWWELKTKAVIKENLRAKYTYLVRKKLALGTLDPPAVGIYLNAMKDAYGRIEKRFADSANLRTQLKSQSKIKEFYSKKENSEMALAVQPARAHLDRLSIHLDMMGSDSSVAQQVQVAGSLIPDSSKKIMLIDIIAAADLAGKYDSKELFNLKSHNEIEYSISKSEDANHKALVYGLAFAFSSSDSSELQSSQKFAQLLVEKVSENLKHKIASKLSVLNDVNKNKYPSELLRELVNTSVSEVRSFLTGPTELSDKVLTYINRSLSALVDQAIYGIEVQIASSVLESRVTKNAQSMQLIDPSQESEVFDAFKSKYPLESAQDSDQWISILDSRSELVDFAFNDRENLNFDSIGQVTIRNSSALTGPSHTKVPSLEIYIVTKKEKESLQEFSQSQGNEVQKRLSEYAEYQDFQTKLSALEAKILKKHDTTMFFYPSSSGEAVKEEKLKTEMENADESVQTDASSQSTLGINAAITAGTSSTERSDEEMTTPPGSIPGSVPGQGIGNSNATSSNVSEIAEVPGALLHGKNDGSEDPTDPWNYPIYIEGAIRGQVYDNWVRKHKAADTSSTDGSYISVSSKITDNLRAVVTAELTQSFRTDGVDDHENNFHTFESVIQEAYIEIRNVGGQPIAFVIGKNEIAFGQNVEMMPIEGNTPTNDLTHIERVTGITMKLDYNILKIIDSIEVSGFTSTPDESFLSGKFKKLDGASVRVSGHLTKQLTFAISALHLIDTDDETGKNFGETRGSFGLIYEGKDGSWKTWVEVLYLHSNPDFPDSHAGLTVGYSHDLGPGQLVLESTWIQNATAQLGVGYSLNVTKNLIAGMEVRYFSGHSTGSGFSVGFEVTYKFFYPAKAADAPDEVLFGKSEVSDEDGDAPATPDDGKSKTKPSRRQQLLHRLDKLKSYF